MATSVNLDNLRLITGGNAELEATLFASFFKSADGCLESMRKSLSAGDDVVWQKQAHTLKGASINLGATGLSELCAHAQGNCHASTENKRAMLASIEAVYKDVKDFLASTSGL